MPPQRPQSRVRERNPIRIMVVGEPGAGKTTFIERLARHHVQATEPIAGHWRKPIQTYLAQIPSPRTNEKYWVKFIDCPGFDHENLRPDEETLTRVLNWLNAAYGRGQKLHGIIYMTSINQNRFSGFSARNIAMFKELIGKDYHRNVVFGTTMWDELPNIAEGAAREDFLKTSPMMWLSMVRGGAKVLRIGDQPDRDERQAVQRGYFSTDLAVVYEIARNHPDWVLAQHQMADNDGRRDRTSAWQVKDAWTRYYAKDTELDAELDQSRVAKDQEVARHDERLRDKRKREKKRLSDEIDDEEAKRVEEAIALQKQQDHKNDLQRQLDSQSRRPHQWPLEQQELEEAEARLAAAESDRGGRGNDSDRDDGRTTVSSSTNSSSSSTRPPPTGRPSSSKTARYLQRKVLPGGRRGHKTIEDGHESLNFPLRFG